MSLRTLPLASHATTSGNLSCRAEWGLRKTTVLPRKGSWCTPHACRSGSCALPFVQSGPAFHLMTSRSKLIIDSKADESPVTRADREAEAAMRQLLAERVPEHAIFGAKSSSESQGFVLLMQSTVLVDARCVHALARTIHTMVEITVVVVSR